MKQIFWVGDSLEELRSAPEEVRAGAGYQLRLVQQGEMPTDFKPMPGVGPGAVEIRLHGENEYRVFYVAKFEEGVYVLHCFEKKTRTTPKRDLEIAKKRYAAITSARRLP